VHLYFSSQPRPSNLDPDQLKSLLTFKEQISELGLHGSFESTDDLKRKVQSALSFYESDVSSHRRNDYFEHGVSDRVYEEASAEWAYRLGAPGSNAWDASANHSRTLIVRDRRGLGSFTISLNKDGDRSAPPFGDGGLPDWKVDPASTRSSPGEIEIKPARRKTGTSFAQDIKFVPQLSEGDRVELFYSGQLPSYKFAHVEDVIAGSSGSNLGLRDWDFNSFVISHPIGLFTYSVFLPDELGATPLGPRVDHSGVIDSELTSELLKNGYSQERVSREGREGVLMKISVREPSYKGTYRLMWRPPSSGA
jgi:hypothetical protein